MQTDFEVAAGEAFSPAVSVKPQGILVLGSHPATKSKAPFDDNWLVYACSPDNSPFGFGHGASPLPRVDVWFEVHVPVFDKSRPYQYLEWLSTLPKVYMRDRLAMAMTLPNGQKLFPTAELYPEKEIKDTFGPFTFTSSIAFQIAKAIVDIEAGLADRQIGIFGVMQASPNEYTTQRPGIQNLIWEATQRDIKVVVPRESRLFEPQPEDF